MTVHYLKGDATHPKADGAKIIVHICNDAGKWGKGFVLAISKRWPEPESAYRNAFKASARPALGDVQFIDVTDDITVANVIGQHGIRLPANKAAPVPIRYEAIRTGLQKVATYALPKDATIHMPRIGCGLAGGKWEEVEPIIIQMLVGPGLDTFVYDF